LTLRGRVNGHWAFADTGLAAGDEHAFGFFHLADWCSAEPRSSTRFPLGKRRTDLVEIAATDWLGVMASKMRIGDCQLSEKFHFGHSENPISGAATRFPGLVSSFSGADAFARRGIVGNHKDENPHRRHRMNETAEEACKDIEQHSDERALSR
jgi:hypothetical protein